MELTGKTALITGGGTGLGREIALRLAGRGMHIGVGYSRSRNDAESTAAEIRSKGVQAVALQADLSSTAESAKLIESFAEEFGRLDLLIHNAGTTRFVPFSNLEAIDEAAWDEIFAVNTRSAFFLARAAAPLMRRNGGGQIITTSSIAGLSAAGSSLPYSVSKAALIHLSKCLATALAPDIRVNSVAPGLLITRWVDGFPPERLELMAEKALLKKNTDVGDTAAAFVMLAENESITGQTIVVDAGLLGA
jgi:3-oxoacyl-[acyl-carrier protein] reductase